MIGILYKTLTVPVKCSGSDYDYLLRCNRESARIWNSILEIEEEYRKKNDGKWVNRSVLQMKTKGLANLHAKGIQQVCHRYLYAREAATKAQQGKGENNKYPHRQKKYMNTIWDYQAFKVRNSTVFLTKPIENIAGKRKIQEPVKCFVRSLPENIVQIELIHKNQLYLAIKYKEESSYIQINSDNHASIDLGEIHAITSIDSRGNAVIITGRKVRAIKQLRNKQHAKLKSKMSKTEEGSKQYIKYKKALKSISFKTEEQILDATHKISKLYLDFCIRHHISVVYYGDLDSATRNTKKKFKGTKVTQKLSQWNYGQLIRILENKLSVYGIKMVKVKEYYTSQTCPACGERHKPTGRDYVCKCGYKQHRDIVGAINILNQNAGTNIKYYKEKKYLRIS
ncbi:transposase [Lederbergia citrisecunda]|uniref:RNA-guided endonuclease InsQ/TnpB family protein n=1 Tax=Lederbergia citrisecunda TaxID=2833583 RepID=UPI003D2B5C0B